VKVLIFRSAAFGDCLVTTPVLRYLRSQGHELYVVTSERGMQVFKNNPNIHKLIKHDEGVKIENLADHIEWLQRKNHCERVIDFSESIEVALSQHPRGPDYKLPKYERIARFNRNFYEYSFEHCQESWDGVSIKPELFFDESELKEARKHLKDDHFNVLVGLSGSGNNKCYPRIMDLCNQISQDYPKVHIITVGDLKCQILEDSIEGNVTKLSGNIPMRTSMALTGLVDLVISPDTGLLHASGCYPTPKIGLLGHNTIECITKHFENDYSLEADPKLAPCAPCMFLIYNMKLQCPLNPITNSSICMSDGLPQETVYKRFTEVYTKYAGF
jgi:ADP-heptose:LPS heptosyltransferase